MNRRSGYQYFSKGFSARKYFLRWVINYSRVCNSAKMSILTLEEDEEATTGTSRITILLDMPESDDCRWLPSDWPVSSGELGNSAGSASLTVKALSSDILRGLTARTAH